MDNLESKWKQLNLSIEEDIDIVMDEGIVMEEIRKGKNSIIGKLHLNWTINKEVLHSTLSKVCLQNHFRFRTSAQTPSFFLLNAHRICSRSWLTGPSYLTRLFSFWSSLMAIPHPWKWTSLERLFGYTFTKRENPDLSDK